MEKEYVTNMIDIRKLIVEPDNWDKRFMGLADLISTWSEDQSRKVGAVIVGNAHEIRSTGFNGLPRKISATDQRRHSREEGEKYLWFEHAERNAIYNAARMGVPTDGCTIYSSLFPCSACVSAIIQCGITTLCTFAPPDDDQQFGRSFVVALQMAKESGLKIRVFS